MKKIYVMLMIPLVVFVGWIRTNQQNKKTAIRWFYANIGHINSIADYYIKNDIPCRDPYHDTMLECRGWDLPQELIIDPEWLNIGFIWNDRNYLEIETTRNLSFVLNKYPEDQWRSICNYSNCIKDLGDGWMLVKWF